MKLTAFKNRNTTIKKNILFFLFNLLALSPLICFSFQHFSIDSYGSMNNLDGHCLWWIGCFRYSGSAICKLWFLLGDNPVTNPALDTFVFIVLAALSASILSRFILNKLSAKSLLSGFIVNISVLITITNIWFTNILTFPECTFANAIGVLLCFVSLTVFFGSRFNKAIRILLSGILLVCSTAVFQQFLVVFIIYAVLLTSIEIIEKNEQKAKQVIITYLKLAAFIVSVTVVYYVIGVGLQKMFDVAPNSRVALSLDVIIDNLKYFAFNQHSYLNGRGMFNTELLTICYLAVFLVWIVSFIYHVRKKGFTTKSLFLLLSYCAAYGSSYLMGLISTSRGMRTMFGLFSVFALFSIGSLILMNKRPAKIILCVVLATVFAMNIVKTVEMSVSQYQQNTVELTYAQLYMNEINKYEAESSTIVKNIELCTDRNCDLASGENALIVSYAFEPLMEYVSGREFKVKNMSEDTRAQKFNEKDWKAYSPSEQLIFENDTLYLCVY